MINDRGEHLDELAAKGVPLVAGPKAHENGKCAWVVDPDGNKVELWEA